MAIESIKYPRILSVYNSERREQKGDEVYVKNYKTHGLTTFYKMGQVQSYRIDAENHTDVILFTYANGVKVKLVNPVGRWSTTTGGTPCIEMDYTIQHIDIDGNVIHESGRNTIYNIDATTSTMSGVQILYNPTGVSYWQGSGHQTVFGDEAQTVTFDRLYAHRAGVEASNAPNLMNVGAEYPEYNYLLDEGVADYYYISTGFSVNTQEEYDDFINDIVDGGDGTPISPILPSDDTSDPGGGDEENPDYNPFSDPIDFPDLPTGGDSISTGFIRVYTPSAGQLQQLAGVLWSDSFANTIKKIQNDPMEAIISLHSVPFGLVGSSVECRIGNFNSGVNMPAINHQFFTLDLGSIYIPEHWASALDYSPYVTIDCFLPFVGVISLQVDDIIGRTVHVKYNVDVLSGACVASVMCGNSVLYAYNTNLILRHPISQSSYGPLYQSILGMAGNTVHGAVRGGIGGAAGGAIGSAINTAISKHSNISRGGSIGGASGCLGNFTPYLIIHRPIQSLASGFAHFKGYPSNITGTIGSVSGYTEVESVHLTGIPCTDIERDEINALLYNGVIV